MNGPVVVLLSTMDHTMSGRRVLASGSRSACELALRSGCAVIGLHGGDPAEAGLKDALHMGLPRIEVIAMPQDADPLQPLAAHLRSLRPAFIVAGQMTESGDATGMLPYHLGAVLDAPVVAASRAVTLHQDALLVECNLGQGRVRQVGCPKGSILLADTASLRPRYGSFAAMRRGRIDTVRVETPPVRNFPVPSLTPARRRPRPIQAIAGDTVAERLHKISDGLVRESGRAVALSPEAVADRIIEEAVRLRLLPPSFGAKEEP